MPRITTREGSAGTKRGKDIVTRQTLWIQGEVGDRLTALRNDPLYQTSAKVINNMIPTELGNLEIVKKYESYYQSPVTNISSPLKVLESKYGFEFIICSAGVVTVDQETKQELHYTTWSTSQIDKSVNVNIIENFIFVCAGTYADIYEINTTTGEVALSLFKDSMLLPLKFQEVMRADIYQVRTYGANTAPYRITSVDNPTLEQKSGNLYVGDTDYKITRIYTYYQADLVSETIPGLVAGEYILVIYPYKSNDESDFMLANTTFNWTGLSSDISGEYYTNTDLADGVKGDLYYGKIIDIRDNIVDAVEYENRVALLTDDYIHFSKIDDYNNFRNGYLATDAFYFRPTPIGGSQPTYLKFLVGQGLYTVSTRGVYVAGYNTGISPTNLTNMIISESNCTYECVLVEKTVFFIDIDGNFKAVQDVSAVTGVIDFKTFDVEKFAVRQEFRQLDVLKIKTKDYIIATNDLGTNFFYWERDTNSFARTRVDMSDYTGFTGQLTTIRNRIVVDGHYLFRSNSNVAEASITINPPYAVTAIGQSLTCDYNSDYQITDIRVLNQDNEAIDDVYINRGDIQHETKFREIGGANDGIYSVYRMKRSMKLITPMTITFVTNENEKIFELQAIELYHSQAGL